MAVAFPQSCALVKSQGCQPFLVGAFKDKAWQRRGGGVRGDGGGPVGVCVGGPSGNCAQTDDGHSTSNHSTEILPS